MTELKSDWPQIIHDMNGKKLHELAPLFAEPASFKGMADAAPIMTDLGRKIDEVLRAEAAMLSAGFNGARDRLEIGLVTAKSSAEYAFVGEVTGTGKSGFALKSKSIGVKLSLSENPNGEGQFIESMEITPLMDITQG